MARLNLLAQPQPFLGILGASAGWALPHQVGSDAAFDACAGGGLVTVIVSLLGLALIVAAALYCLLGWRKAEGSGRRIMAAIGLMLAAIGGFAVVLQIAAGLILPQCAA